jgi:hypothetical protein
MSQEDDDNCWFCYPLSMDLKLALSIRLEGIIKCNQPNDVG